MSKKVFWAFYFHIVWHAVQHTYSTQQDRQVSIDDGFE